jgi:hypothetical protein
MEDRNTRDNFVSQGRKALVGHNTLDRFEDEPDTTHLLMNLTKHHWGRDRFVISPAWAPKLGLSKARFLRARDRLLDPEDGELVCLHPGGRGPNDPALFAWRNRRRR